MTIYTADKEGSVKVQMLESSLAGASNIATALRHCARNATRPLANLNIAH